MTKRTTVTDLGFLGVLTVVWTWPIVGRFATALPGLPGDNFIFIWNMWWARRSFADASLTFFHSSYLFSPFGADLVNHSHTALQGFVGATLLAPMTLVEAQNFIVLGSVFLNAAAAYLLAVDITGQRRPALLAGIIFGTSPYLAAHLLGHFDLLSAWVLPVFAYAFRRALLQGSLPAAGAAGVCLALAAYAAYYYVVYLSFFLVGYLLVWWRCCHLRWQRRSSSRAAAVVRRAALGLLVLDVVVIVSILATGGFTLQLGTVGVDAHTLNNPLLVGWAAVAALLLTRWRIRLDVNGPAQEAWWRGIRAVAIIIAVFTVGSLPLIAETWRLVAAGDYASQTYFWRSAPPGIDVLALFSGNPFHSFLRRVPTLGCGPDFGCLERVSWLGLVPLVVLLTQRRQWLDVDEARRWKVVFVLFLVWALGPFLTVGGINLGLPLPQILGRFVPLVDNARIPGRAMVGAYLALAMLVAIRLAAGDPSRRRAAFWWVVIALAVFDFLGAPIPTTALDRPAVYQRLADIHDDGPVIEVPFGFADGLSAGRGVPDRRSLYYATIHGHPLVGGFVARMPSDLADRYAAMPVVGNLLRLSEGAPPEPESSRGPLAFRYLVLDLGTASPALVAYVHDALDLRLVLASGGRELYRVFGVKPR